MKNLSPQDFERARAFIRSQARPLDQRLFEYLFESGPGRAVIAELERYQNSDGGLGHALEPDFRLKASSSIATSLGSQYLREVGATEAESIVQKGIQYFISTYDPDRKGWLSTPREVNDEPHAPWWHHEDGGNAVDKLGWGNPSAEIVGYLHEYAGLVPDGFLCKVTEMANAQVEALPDEIDVHTTLCYLRMLDTVPEPTKSIALEKLKNSARRGIESSPDWPGVGTDLRGYAPSPASYLADVLADRMRQYLDDEITNQAEDGSWLPNWTWGGHYENAWKEAEREWKGFLTVQALKTLRAYGRIESL